MYLYIKYINNIHVLFYFKFSIIVMHPNVSLLSFVNFIILSVFLIIIFT